MSRLPRFYVLYLIAFVSALFLIRNIYPINFVPDEAEQLLLVDKFQLYYQQVQQPPLFTWLYFLLTKIFGANVLSISLLIHSLIFLSFYAFYKLVQEFFSCENSALVAFALFLLPVYSITLERYYTHLNVLTLFAILTLLSYMHLWKKPSLNNYMIFAFVVGLGFLTKYNYAWIFFEIFFVGLFFPSTRALLFNWRALLSAFLALTIAAPHYIALWMKDWGGLSYALARAEVAELGSLGIFLKNIFNIYSVFLLSLFVLALCFYAQFRVAELDEKKRFLLMLAFCSLVLPLGSLILLKMNYFCPRWMAGIAFVVPLCLFTFIDLDGVSNARKKIFIALTIFLPSMVVLDKAIAAFNPNLLKNAMKIQRPYAQTVKDLNSWDLNQVLVYDAPDIVVSFAKQKTNFEFYDYHDHADLDLSKKILIVSKNKIPNDEILQALPNYQKVANGKLINPYQGSENEFFRLYLLNLMKK